MATNTNTEVYGVKAPKQALFDVKSKGLKPTGIRFPITTDTGYFKKSSGITLVKENLRQLLLTKRGERVMLPNFGTDLRNYLMEPMDQALFSRIKTDIMECMSRYARGVKLLKIQIIPGETPTHSGGHHLKINLFCAIVEEENVTFEVKVDLF